MPFVSAGIAQGGVELNSLISALVSSLPRLPQLALEVAPHAAQQQQASEEPSASAGYCTPAPLPRRPPVELCPWSQREAHGGEGECVMDEPRDYIIAPPLASEPAAEGPKAEEGQKRKRDTTPS